MGIIKRTEHFYPRPPGGGRRQREICYKLRSYHFYPRPPGGGRLHRPCRTGATSAFLSTPSGWRATPPRAVLRTSRAISIHALRVEGDGIKMPGCIDLPGEFLSTPSGWRATFESFKSGATLKFLSTPSGWRATILSTVLRGAQRLFLSTPCGWRDTSRSAICRCSRPISIHALRVEGDSPARLTWLSAHWPFLSTPSGWRATAGAKSYLVAPGISIHALRVEGDRTS